MNSKRILTIALCLVMVLSGICAFGVSADETSAAAEQTVRIEAENAVYNIYTKTESYSGASGGTQVGGAPGTPTYASWDDADSTEDLVGGFIDKSNDPYAVFYVDAPEAGIYKLSTGNRFYLTAATDNAYAAFLVNPSLKIQDPAATVAYQAYYGAVAANAGTYLVSEAVEVELVKGRNVIFVTPVTAEQNVKWATVDYIDITGGCAVTHIAPDTVTLHAGNAPYVAGYTTVNADGYVGDGNWGTYYQTAIADMSLSNAGNLRGFTYTVNAPADGYYDITAAYESAASGAEAYAVGLLVDGQPQAREFAFTGGASGSKGYVDLSVYLTEGDHVLTFTAPAKRTADDSVGNNVVWFNYNELYLYGGLTESVIQSNPAMDWWYAEAEYQDEGYAVWHNYSAIETNHSNTFRDYTNANYADYQAKSAVGGGNAVNNYSLAQLQEGRLDKSTTTGITVYVEAPEAGSYDFYAYYRLNCPGIWGTITPYSVFMVNGEFGAQADFLAGGKDWSYNTETVQLSLEKGLNEITFIPLTKDQYVSGNDWASVDCIFVDTALQVAKVPTGSVTYTPEQGVANLYTKIDTDGTIGYDKRTAANYYNVKAATLTHDMLHTVPFMGYTVEAPYDGFYNISLNYKSNGVNAENYAIAVLVDEGTEAEVKHLVTDTTGTADVSTYLTAGTHTVAFTLALPISDSHTGTVVWCNLGDITMNGGLVLAENQVNPLYYGLTVMEAETDAYINRHNPDSMKQAQTYASGGYDIGNAYSSTQTVEQVKQHLDSTIQPYAEYLVEAETDGEYTLMIGVRGKFSTGYKVLLQVNGTVYEQACRFDDNVSCHLPVTVSLKKGVNTIRSLAATSDIGWVNQDCLGLPAGLTAVTNGGDTIQEADKLANMGNYNYKVDDGRYWGQDGLDNSLASEVTLETLSENNFLEASWYSVTVEAPAAGWYGVQTHVWIPTVETAQLGKIGVLANGTAYEAKLWQDSSATTHAEAFVYLNKGINDLIFTGILADSNIAVSTNGDTWMDGDYIVLTGGVKVAGTQRYPVQGLVPGSVYTVADGTVTVPAGTTEAELKSNFFGDVTVSGNVVSYAGGESYTVVYDEAQTEKSMGADQILALDNPVGRLLSYRGAAFMESSASGFTLTGQLQGDVSILIRAEEGKSNGGVACIYVEIDGAVSQYSFNVTTTQQITIASNLPAGSHTIKVTKGTDAKYDMLYVYAVRYTGTLTQSTPADMGIEFLGDSITVGYGLYEPDVSLKNAMSGSYYSYANVTADILGADHYTIGNGAWRFGENTGAEGDTRYLGYIYEKNSMNLNLGSYDFAWQPDVVVINLGTNDGNQHTFVGADVEGATAADIIAANQEVWSADIAALLTMVRSHNPNAKIYWVYGAMEDVTTNASKEVIVPLIQNGVTAYNEASGDAVTYVHVTNDVSGVYDHPTREGHKVIGREVADAIIGITTSTLEAETHSVYWRYTAEEAGAVSNAIGGVQPGTDAYMQSYADLVAGAKLKKTEHPMMSFVVDVEAEGDYVLDVAYRAGMKTGTINDYFIVVGVDDVAYTKTQYVSAHPNNANWTLGQATVHLTAGRHTIRLITMLSDTRSETLYTNWINIDYVDVSGYGKVTAVEPQWTHLQSGEATYYANFATVGSTELADYGDWYASTLGGYRGDSTAEGLTVDNFSIYDLSKLGYFSYTVDVPADGYYDLQTYIRCYNDYTHFRTGHILLAVDDQVNWYPAEHGYSVLKWNAQDLSVYLTKGVHTLTVSGIIGDIGTCAKNWCDMGALSVSGGITLAAEQIDPLTLLEKKDTQYVDAANGSDANPGTAEKPVATLDAAMRRIADGGTVHLVGTVTGEKGLPTVDGTVTITGGTLDLSAHETVWMNSGIIFDDVTVKFLANSSTDGAYSGASLFANGYPLTIRENVTVQNYIFLYGGNKNAHVENAQLNIYAGDYLSIYGGGYNGNVTGTVKLNVGGDVNTAFGESMVLNHDGPNYIDIQAGSYNGTVGKTEVTFGGNAIARMIFAGGSQSGANVTETHIYVDGGKAAAVYGGGRNSATVGTTNVIMTGGVIEQVYGGGESGTVTGDCRSWILGGEITRRLGGGSYDGTVNGTTYLILGEGLDYSRSYTKTVLGMPVPTSEDITARNRSGSINGNAYLFFNSQAAYSALYGELASDPADNLHDSVVTDIEQWNVTLKDNIGANFCLKLGSDMVDKASVRLTVAGTSQTAAASTMQTQDAYYKFTLNMAAAMMADEITADLMVNDVIIESNVYSITAYANYILSSDSFDAATKAMVKEMLNYGAAAQTYFAYNTDHLATAGVDLTGVGAETVPETDDDPMAISGALSGIECYGATLVFRNKITVRFYFKVTGDIADYTFKANGETVQPQQSGGMYYVDVAGITPDKLADQVVLTVNDTITVEYSPLNYMIRMNARETTADTLKALLKAMYNYYLTAKGYTANA